MKYHHAMDKLMIFVGRIPQTRKGAGVRRAIRETLREHPYLCVEFADDASRPENVRPLIDFAFLGLFDVSRSREVGGLLDLGYALGRHRFCILLRGRQPAWTDLSADTTVDYRSLRDLRMTLEASWVGWVGRAIRKYTAGGEVFANMNAQLIARLGAQLLEANLSDEFTTASRHGFSEEQVETTLGILRDLGMARAIDSGWTATDFGRVQLPRLIASMG